MIGHNIKIIKMKWSGNILEPRRYIPPQFFSFCFTGYGCSYVETFRSNMYTTYFHPLACVSDDRRLFSDHIFLSASLRPEMMIPVAKPFFLVLHIISFVIATTTSEQTLPSLLREEEVEATFITDSDNSCILPRCESSRST